MRCFASKYVGPRTSNGAATITHTSGPATWTIAITNAVDRDQWSWTLTVQWNQSSVTHDSGSGTYCNPSPAVGFLSDSEAAQTWQVTTTGPSGTASLQIGGTTVQTVGVDPSGNATLNHMSGSCMVNISLNTAAGGDTWHWTYSKSTSQSGIVYSPAPAGTGSLTYTTSGGALDSNQASKPWLIVVDGPNSSGNHLRLLVGGEEVATVALNGSGSYNIPYTCGAHAYTFTITNPSDQDHWFWNYTQAVTDLKLPQMEQRHEYAGDGGIKRVSIVDQTGSDSTAYGPEKYVVEYSKDKAGRARGKTVRTNRVDDESIHYESDYGYDGRGRLVRERILRWDNTLKRMVTTQDIRTTYDLGNNPVEIDFYDDQGSAYTETRTYARGYQLTGRRSPICARGFPLPLQVHIRMIQTTI